MRSSRSWSPTLAYVAPFAIYVGTLPLPRTAAVSALRLLIVAAVILLVSRPALPGRPAHPWASIGVGIAVFLIWVGPDLLFGYRHHWLFENALTGKAASTLDPSL